MRDNHRRRAALVALALAATLGVTGAAPATAASDRNGRPRSAEPKRTPRQPARVVWDRGRDDVDGSIRPADIVQADDVIVQGSMCVGIDCVNGEVFDFDTLRLKENNTRMAFVDTSLAGFPTDDWELTANDSAGGGLDRFSIANTTDATIPFTVAGDATTNALVVGAGRIGIGTAEPALAVHAVSDNTPAIRLAQTAVQFTAQTWDIGANEANFFVRDITNASLLPLRIRPGAPTSSLDIAANGDVGLGTQAPQDDLHLTGSDPQRIRLQTTGGTASTWDAGATADGSFTIDSVAGTGAELTVTGQGMVRVLPRRRPPTQGVAMGAMYNDTSKALCWYDGARWLKVAGPGSCR
ncbi:MAG: hypothetical protein ACKOTZ_10760 [Chloroflexota bacterium]